MNAETDTTTKETDMNALTNLIDRRETEAKKIATEHHQLGHRHAPAVGQDDRAMADLIVKAGLTLASADPDRRCCCVTSPNCPEHSTDVVEESTVSVPAVDADPAMRWTVAQRLALVDRTISAIEDEHSARSDNSRYCTEGSCRECQVIERINLAVAGYTSPVCDCGAAVDDHGGEMDDCPGEQREPGNPGVGIAAGRYED